MLTPLDIQNKEFDKSIRGYNVSSVDIFLKEVYRDYERIYRENMELMDKLETLRKQIKNYDDIEETLKNTLVVAQKTSEEVVINARNKAEDIIKEAEREAKEIITSANLEVRSINEKYESAKEEILVFEMRFKTLLSSQLETVNSYMKELKRDIK